MSTDEAEHLDHLVGITEDAHIGPVPNEYEGIKEMLRDETLTFVRVSETAGFYIDDNGMLNGSKLNVCASMFAGRPLYGPVVLTYATPDDEGETLCPLEEDAMLLMHFAIRWHNVVENAQRIGQDLSVIANPDTIPPPEIIPLDDEALRRFFGEAQTEQ